MPSPSTSPIVHRRRIALVTNSFSTVGGAENATQGIVRRLTSAGHHVTVLLPASETLPPAVERDFTIERLPDLVFQLGLRNVWFARTAKANASARLRHFDAVMFCMLQSAMALFPFFRHPNWLVTCRGGDIQDPRKTPYRRLVAQSPYGIHYKGYRTRWTNELFLRLFLWRNRGRGLFVSISKDMVDELVELGVPRDRTRKILNGVDLGRFRRIQAHTRILGRDPSLRYVLCVGRNDSRKGFYQLLDAAGILAARGIIDVRFVIKGRGFARLVDFAKELGLGGYFSVVDEGWNVDFSLEISTPSDGHLPDRETVGLYKLADVVLIPSFIEALSNVGLEAEASDRSLVVSDTFGCREYVRRGTAMGFETGNPDALVDALLDLLADPRRQRALRAARQRWLPSLDVDECARAYVDEIERGLGQVDTGPVPRCSGELEQG